MAIKKVDCFQLACDADGCNESLFVTCPTELLEKKLRAMEGWWIANVPTDTPAQAFCKKHLPHE